MKRTWNTKTYILIIVLPLVILPIITVSIYATISFYKRTFAQTNEFYQGIISQVTTNIDFYYNQYKKSFESIIDSPIMEMVLNRPKMTALEDKDYTIDGVYYLDLIKERFTTKFNGGGWLLELDREHSVDKTPYICSRIVHTNVVFDVKDLTSDQVFKKIQEDKDSIPIMGAFPFFKGMNSTNRIIFLYPTYKDDTSEIESVMVIIESNDFMAGLYNENFSLKFGTLYVMDLFKNIQGSNHPSVDDYYEYDSKKKSYILNPGDDPNDPYEGMSFAEYRMLNTDSQILSQPDVLEQIKAAENSEDALSQVVSFNGHKFLSIVAVAPISGMHIAYFHPINQLFNPIQKTIYIIILISAITAFIVIFVGISFSRNFTSPIIELKMRLKKICCGNYEERLEPNKFFGEFVTLSDSFNHMVDTMSNYRNNMEQLVQERTEELNKTVAQLTETHEQNRRELVMAQKIQSSLIPKVFPETRLLQFSSKYMPMEALGGDLYDVYQISDKVFSVMILDVCGHGVPAALITTMAKMSFSNNAKKAKNPNNVIFNVNNELFDVINGNGDYFTAFYGVIDMEKGMLYYSNAGHNTIFLAHADNSIDRLENNGPVVGVVKDLPFQSNSHTLRNGDRLVLYTDGVIEARDESARLYGEERLTEIIQKNMTSNVKDFTEHVFADLQSFCGNSPRSDDIALFAIDIIGIN